MKLRIMQRNVDHRRRPSYRPGTRFQSPSTPIARQSDRSGLTAEDAEGRRGLKDKFWHALKALRSNAFEGRAPCKVCAFLCAPLRPRTGKPALPRREVGLTLSVPAMYAELTIATQRNVQRGGMIMIKRRLVLHAFAATILTGGLATTALAQYGDMLKDAGKAKAKEAVDAAAPAPAAATGGGTLNDAASAGTKKAIDAKMGGADMKGAGVEGVKTGLDTLQGKPAMPAAKAAPAAADDAEKGE